MPLWHAIILGAIQGFTEFVPISSTAHLDLAQRLLGTGSGADALAFDIVLHLGTALAILVVYWRELLRMAEELLRWVARQPARHAAERALVLPLIIGTIPGVLVGFSLLPWFEAHRTPLVIGLSMLVAAAFFTLAERVAARREAQHHPRTAPTVRDSLWVGVAQGAAGLLAGFSRSGFTISTGRLVGLTREAAAKFSFLLAFVIICGAGAKTLLELRHAVDFPISVTALGVGFVTSAITGFLAVRFLLKYLRTHSLRWFAVYLGVLGAVLVVATSLGFTF